MKVKKICLLLLVSLLLLTACQTVPQGSQETDRTEPAKTGLPSEEPTAPTAEETVPTSPTPTQPPEPVRPDPSKGPVRVVCIGDSITEGVGVSDPAADSYPAVLQKVLGEQYEVKNYGKGGATLCSESTKLYQAKSWFTYSGKYEALLAEAPQTDVALIMLGTNDGNSSVDQIRMLLTDHADEFRKDYGDSMKRLVGDLRKANPNMDIYILNSPKCFRTGNSWEATLQAFVRPLQKELAEELGLKWIDIYRFSAEEMGQAAFPDNLHPSENGYRKLAAYIGGILAEAYGTTLLPLPTPPVFAFEESFDGIADGTVITDKNKEPATLGNTGISAKVIEGSSISVNGGVLSLERVGSDAYFDVSLPESLKVNECYRFAIAVKAGENFNSRGCFFFIFGKQFARFHTDGTLRTGDGKEILGQLPTDRFAELALQVDTGSGTYSLIFDGKEVDAGTFEFKEVSSFRPVQFFASGSSILMLDSMSVIQQPKKGA